MSGPGDSTATDLRIAVTGAGGRMGRKVIEAAADRDAVDDAVAVNRTAPDPAAGVAVGGAVDSAAGTSVVVGRIASTCSGTTAASWWTCWKR